MKVTRAQLIGTPECPFMKRWVLQTRFGSIRLHHWMGSDDLRNQHDHPWSFLTIVLKGGYDDLSTEQIDCPACDSQSFLRLAGDCQDCGNSGVIDTLKTSRMSAGRVQYRHAHHRHSVKVDPGGCWTLIFTSADQRKWGYWVGKFWKAHDKYRRDHGYMPCDP